MAVYEIFGSRDRVGQQSGIGSTAELQFIVDGTDNDQTAMDAVAGYAPLEYYKLQRDSITLRQLSISSWEASVSYVDPDSEDNEEDDVELGEGVFSFDTTGETEHITNVKKGAEKKQAKLDSDAADLAGGIGVGPDGVEGVDIVAPSLRLSYRTRLPREFVTIEWIKDVARATGTTNNYEFYSFKTGELLFLGATGEESASRNPEVTFQFSASENIEDRVYELHGDTTTTVSKTGHQYQWFYYRHEKDAASSTVVLKPIAVFVDTVYEESDFTKLGIGGTPKPEEPPEEE